MPPPESPASDSQTIADLNQVDQRLTLFNVLSGNLLGATALVSQPFLFYLKSGLHLQASEVSVYMALMMFPWLCKPIFGLFSDNIPLFGYRRRSYLIALNAIAAICSSAVLAGTPASFIFSYAVLQIAIAASTVITLGTGVQYGRETGQTKKYLLLQTVFYHCGVMAAAIAGGWICKRYLPAQAIQFALPAASAFALLLALATFKLMVEKKTSVDPYQIKKTLKLTLQHARSSKSLLSASMIFCWSIAMALSVPLYYYETNVLHFEQELVGMLNGINSAGMLAGTAIYAICVKNQSFKTHLRLLLALGLLSIFSYLLLSTPMSACAIEAVRGMANMIGLLIIYGLAAEICLPGAEVFVMGYLVAMRTLGMEFWTAVNGYVFSNFLHEQFPALTVIAGAICLCTSLPSYLLSRSSK